MKSNSVKGLIAGGLFLAASAANATVIDYTLDSLGGNTYQYNYTLENDTLGFDVDQFSVYFDLGLYENLAVTATPADWFGEAFQPDPLFPDDGFFDTFTDGFITTNYSPVAAGDSLAGFSVSFDWTGGVGGPGDQYFELYDINWDLIGSGLTTLVDDGGATVPEPASLPLFAIGMLGLWSVRRKKQ